MVERYGVAQWWSGMVYLSGRTVVDSSVVQRYGVAQWWNDMGVAQWWNSMG